MVTKIEANAAPAAVIVENLPDGNKRVILHKDITRSTVEKDGNKQTIYCAAETSFYVADREITQAAIKANFNDWWAYGENYDEAQRTPTIEERLAAIEQFMALTLTEGI